MGKTRGRSRFEIHKDKRFAVQGFLISPHRTTDVIQTPTYSRKIILFAVAHVIRDRIE
jgi:hypothetical protein